MNPAAMMQMAGVLAQDDEKEVDEFQVPHQVKGTGHQVAQSQNLQMAQPGQPGPLPGGPGPMPTGQMPGGPQGGMVQGGGPGGQYQGRSINANVQQGPAQQSPEAAMWQRRANSVPETKYFRGLNNRKRGALEERALAAEKAYRAEQAAKQAKTIEERDKAVKKQLDIAMNSGAPKDQVLQAWERYRATGEVPELMSKKKPTYTQDVNKRQRWVDGPNAGKLVFPEVATAEAEMDLTDTLSTEEGLRKEVNALTKDFYTVSTAFQNVSAGLEAGSAAGDMAGVFGYMKLLDPNSTVRESEYATAENARGIPESVRNAYNKAMDGQILSPDQRQDFMMRAQDLYKIAEASASTHIDAYRQTALDAGVNPDAVTRAFTTRVEMMAGLGADDAAGPPTFPDEASADAAVESGQIKSGDKIIIGGRQAKVP